MNSESADYYLYQIFNNLDRPPRCRSYLRHHTPTGTAAWVTDEQEATVNDVLRQTPHERDLIDPVVHTPTGDFWIGPTGVHVNGSSKGLSGIWLLQSRVRRQTDTAQADISGGNLNFKDPDQIELFPAS